MRNALLNVAVGLVPFALLALVIGVWAAAITGTGALGAACRVVAIGTTAACLAGAVYALGADLRRQWKARGR